MNTDKLFDDPFAIAGEPVAKPFDAATASFDVGVGDPFGGNPVEEVWDAISNEAEQEGSPEGMAKRVLGEVEQAFKDRATAEQKRMEEAVDSEYWICLVFQTRAQKDEFLTKCGANPMNMGDKYIEGPDFARLIGKPVDPARVRYNISDKLDRRLLDMSRGFDELSGLGDPQPPTGV